MNEASEVIQKIVDEHYKLRIKNECEVKTWVPDLVIGNLYNGPNEYGGLHSDKLTHIGPRPVIASLTLGAGRTFRLVRNATETEPSRSYDFILEHNALLIMFPPCQVRDILTLERKNSNTEFLKLGRSCLG